MVILSKVTKKYYKNIFGFKTKKEFTNYIKSNKVNERGSNLMEFTKSLYSKLNKTAKLMEKTRQKLNDEKLLHMIFPESNKIDIEQYDKFIHKSKIEKVFPDIIDKTKKMNFNPVLKELIQIRKKKHPKTSKYKNLYPNIKNKYIIAEALNKFTQSYIFNDDDNVHFYFPDNFFNILISLYNDTYKILKNELLKWNGVKFNLVYNCSMVKWNTLDKKFDRIFPYFSSKTHTIIHEDVIEEKINTCNDEILDSFDKLINEQSGFSIERIIAYYINIYVYKPMKGNSYIKLPDWIENKQACINVKNTDNKCFLWSIISCIHPALNHVDRVTNYNKFESEFNMTNIKYPVAMSDYKVFEINNNISINVFTYNENKMIYPLFITKQTYDKHVDLLLINENDISHYCYIKSFSRLMNSYNTMKQKLFYCYYCLHGFTREDLLIKHKNDCFNINGIQKITLPNKYNNTLKFENYYKQLPIPFVIYADCESLLKKIDTVSKLNTSSYTEEKQVHEACSFGYKLVCCYDDKYSKPIKINRGENCTEWFMKELLNLSQYINDTIKSVFNKEMILTNDDITNFNNATKCNICNNSLGEDKVKDHDHITGKYRGATHSKCNINYKICNKVPIFFHNLKGYDSHHILSKLGKYFSNIQCIPNNMEKYMAIMTTQYKFVDSMQFMNESLEKLASYLNKDRDFIYTSQYFKENTKLFLMKGIYPYDYIENHEKFIENKLPDKKYFFNKLKNEDITNTDYEHANNVFKTMNCKNIGDYHDLYLISDILLLTDIFENFRKNCFNDYNLDPCHYFSAPSYSWDALLKMTNEKLELLTDIDKYLFIEKGIRGGISVVSHRYAKANNKYMSNYNKTIEDSYIMYLDANNLYGWAMSQYLPHSNFNWLSEKILMILILKILLIIMI